MDESRLLNETRELLKKRPPQLTLATISSRTGINLHWLRKFHLGAFKDPGVNRVEQLHDFLLGEQGADSAEEKSQAQKSA